MSTHSTVQTDVEAIRIERTSLADSAYDTLVESIVRGLFAPATELSAVSLASRFQISRTPVTEALQRLVHDGLVEQLSNHRLRVAVLARQDVIEIYEMRACLEATAAERAATRLSQKQLDELHRQLRHLARASDQPQWAEAAIQFDLSFHDTLAESAAHRRLRDDITRYRRLVRSFCRLTGDRANLKASVKEHLAILVELRRRRPAGARRAMQAHIHRRLQAVLNELYSS